MPSLSNITRADPVTYTAQLGPESVSVTFDAAKMTGRWEREIATAADANDGERVSDLLFGVFIDWDVIDDNGQPVPISKEILLDLPGKALASLIEGMRESVLPASEEGNGSGSTSSTQGTLSSNSQASLQNGQLTSPSLPSSALPSPT
jgi:hypothetical protein